MSNLIYVTGDATTPPGSGTRVIAHVCNNVRKFGRGFAEAIATKWPKAQERYFAWHDGRISGAHPMELGMVQFVTVERNPSIVIANMIAQHGVGMRNGPPIRYDALAAALQKVGEYAAGRQATVHMPRIGTGYAHGEWELIEPLIKRYLVNRGVPVTVYDFPKRDRGLRA